MRYRMVLKEFWSFRQSLVVVLTPVLLAPLPIIMKQQEYRALYGLLVMAVYWVTETIPLPITALLPMVIFPLLGVVKAKELSPEYLKDTNMLFVGGFMIAVAVERWNLHKRVALRVLLLVGSQPKWLMLGFMLPSAFLSMWISNTATTAMMVPIARAVVDQLALTRERSWKYKHKNTTQNKAEEPITQESQLNEDVMKSESVNGQDGTSKCFEIEVQAQHLGENDTKSYDVSKGHDTSQEDMFRDQQQRLDNIRKGVTLSVAYAATCGGVATLTGTGTNLVFKGQADSLFGSQSGINYTSWFVFAFPCSVLSVVMAYIWLQIHFLGFRESIFVWSKPTVANIKEAEATQTILRKELDKLGSMTFAEVMISIHFVALALLWLTRESDFFKGWGFYVSGGYASDSTPAILLAISLFICPSSPPNIFCLRRKTDTSATGPKPALLDWQTVNEKFAWGIMLLLGGGYALAKACQKSGLSQLLANELTVFQNIPAWSMCLIITIVIAAITEVTSNVAIATIFLPILAQLSIGIGVNPLYLMIPGCMATSFAFMLPVATPPNAIVFSYGRVKVVDMARAGIVLNILCIGIVNLAINTWGRLYFKLDVFPAWANITSTPQLITSDCYNITA